MHGARVVTVREGGAGAGEEADAAVTTVTGAVLAVHTADCAPIALVADGGGVAVAHAGWRGLADGVVAAAVDELQIVATGPIRAFVGPLIGPECYEVYSPQCWVGEGLCGANRRVLWRPGT